MSQSSQPMTTNAFGVAVPKPAAGKPHRPSPGRSSFATFLIICSTSFFLGILFSLFPYDYPLIWSRKPDVLPPTSSDVAPATAAILAAAAADPFATMERHLTLLHAAPPLIPRILHIVVATGLLGFFIKLFRPTESNMLFDGASLALYVVAICVYLSNVVKGLRAVSERVWDLPLEPVEVEKDGVFLGVKGSRVGREDSLRVMSASNTILALVLVGVLVLQAGQWYADRKESQELDEMAEGDEKKEGSGNGAARKGRATGAAAKKKN